MAHLDKKLFVAISGGVDSSTAAALLIEQGYDISGVFMITCEQSHHAREQAQKTADSLGIKLHVIDMQNEFVQVLDYFRSEYKKARTPNPCVFCNRFIKFGKLWHYAKENGGEFFATGHYASVSKADDGVALCAADNFKDQSYALAMIDRDILKHLILPLGDFKKTETREIARKLELAAADAQESQEICFIPDDNYIAVIEQISPELASQGDIVDSCGNILGKHQGIHRYTIGQRKGLGVAMGVPYYVVHLDAKNNTVVLGPKDEVMHTRLLASNPNWLIDKPENTFKANVKIRYNHKGAEATVSPHGDKVTVEFDNPILAITPGQLAVFYIDHNGKKRVGGGAWIDEVLI